MSVRPGKKFSFQSAAENLQRRRWPDWLRQTVPDRCSSHWKGAVTNGKTHSSWIDHSTAVAVAVAVWCQITSCSTGAYSLPHMLVSHSGWLQGGRHVWPFTDQLIIYLTPGSHASWKVLENKNPGKMMNSLELQDKQHANLVHTYLLKYQKKIKISVLPIFTYEKLCALHYLEFIGQYFIGYHSTEKYCTVPKTTQS